jgi:hypothetical protein
MMSRPGCPVTPAGGVGGLPQLAVQDTAQTGAAI